MNILVTGGSGFIGKYFVTKLIELTLLVRNIERAKELFGNKVKYIVGDVTKKETLVDCCKNIDIVYHLVAKSGNELPTKRNMKIFNEINVQGTKNIIEEAKKYNIKRFIYVSSTATMGIVKETPINELSKCSPYLPYEVSKYNTEKLLLKEYKENNFPIMILRPTKVYGIDAKDKICSIQMKLCKYGINLIIGVGENKISNIHVKDFCNALINCISFGKIGEIYIVSGPDSISAKEIGKIISKKINKKVLNIRIPKFIIKSIAFLEERIFILLKKKPIVTSKNIEALSHDRIYDLKKAKEQLHYLPQISMEQGINEMLNSYIKDNKGEANIEGKQRKS